MPVSDGMVGLMKTVHIGGSSSLEFYGTSWFNLRSISSSDSFFIVAI